MFDIIRQAALKVMTHYQADLHIDEREIAKFPDTPYLHYTRATGTYVIILQNTESLPAKDERIPHLFGTIDRDGVVRNIGSMADYCANPNHGPYLLVHYFNGNTVRKITVEKAQEIAREHTRKLETALRRERQAQYA